MHSYEFFYLKYKMITFVFILFKKTTTHQYFSRSNKQRIMSDFEQENIGTREALGLLQGQMCTILEHLQTRRDNIVVVNEVDATMMTSIADTTFVIMILLTRLFNLLLLANLCLKQV